jgi:DMSO/TMAO reductase YedYZ molybdopterin-dependent catalytic subunit
MDQRRTALRGALAGGVAGLSAAGAMYLLASVAGVRTLPALLSEPLLAVLPGPVFGFLIDRLQHLGKVIEELGLVLAMLLLLAALGAAVAIAGARRPVAHLPLLAALLAWILVVALALPLGGAGFLGLGDGVATPIVWAVVFAVYAVVLELGLGGQAPVDESRRRLLGTGPLVIGGVAAGYLGLRLVPGWLEALRRPAEAGGRVSEAVTPVADFYVVSKNFTDPALDAGRWVLNVHGLAAAPYRLGYAELVALPARTILTTLECISNNVGGNQISTGEFAGPSLADLVARASPSTQARFVNMRSADGYSESLPLELVAGDPDILVAHTLAGARLRADHGYPARVLIPGRYGMKGPKWLQDVELATSEAGGYWEAQGWDRQAVVRTMSRIDTPLDGAIVTAGPLPVGGVAFAGTRGVSRVEVSTDGGRTWSPADLAAPPSALAWTLWSFDWKPSAGEHTLVVRATDGQGALQSADVMPSFPAGSSGYHRVRVSVSR